MDSKSSLYTNNFLTNVMIIIRAAMHANQGVFRFYIAIRIVACYSKWRMFPVIWSRTGVSVQVYILFAYPMYLPTARLFLQQHDTQYPTEN
jgi:hypothetical protein